MPWLSHKVTFCGRSRSKPNGCGWLFAAVIKIFSLFIVILPSSLTQPVMRDLGILSVLAANMPGPGAMRPELVLIHHTDCGMSRLANPAIQEQVAKRLGLSVDEVSAMAISDPTTSVQDDVDRLRKTPGTPDQLVVSGFVYDVSSGTINQVVPPAPLRAS